MPLGSLEDGRGGFVQDATGGIALLLPADPAEPIVAGALVRASGTVDDRYAQRTIRLDGPPAIVGSAALPEAIAVGTGAASEALEGRLVAVEGAVVETPTSLSTGVSVLIDDGSGPMRVILAFPGASSPVRGDTIRVTGPLGQRDTTGTGTGGYRVLVTDPAAIALGPTPTPTPDADADSGADAHRPRPTPTPDAVADAHADPHPTPPTPRRLPHRLPRRSPRLARSGVTRARPSRASSRPRRAGSACRSRSRSRTPPGASS